MFLLDQPSSRWTFYAAALAYLWAALSSPLRSRWRAMPMRRRFPRLSNEWFREHEIESGKRALDR